MDVTGFKRDPDEEARKFKVPNRSDGDNTTDTADKNKPETRIFDDVVSQKVKRGLLKLFAIPGSTGLPVAIEAKGQSGERSTKQDRNDEALQSNKEKELSGIELLRVPADRIKPEHLADVIDAWLEQPKRLDKLQLGKYRRKDIEGLVELLRAQRGPDGKPLSVGIVIAVTLSFALPLAYPETGEAEEVDPPAESEDR